MTATTVPALADDRLSAVVVPAHCLEKALDAVIEMEEKRDHRRDVERRDDPVLEAADNHGEHVDPAVGKSIGDDIRGELGGEMTEVADDEDAAIRTPVQIMFSLEKVALSFRLTAYAPGLAALFSRVI